MMFVEHLVRSKGGHSLRAQRLTYTRDVAQYQNMQEGPIKTTGNPLDIAIPGEGYFVVNAADGERYTRNGHFSLDGDGQLVTRNNQPLLSDAGTPFFFNPDDKNITFAADGTISTSNGEVGKLRVVKFDKPQNLQKEEAGLYSTDEQPVAMDKPGIIQGALESSNVKPMLEITKMINVQRAYDSVRTFIDKEDARQRKMIQELAPRA
ncbi:MAG: flagellar hook-basal body complex protein, partial [Pseudomonadota bacterium]|nr:flagellar hook-basal body complex protein [Pseudomonadota bacterium]